MADYGELDDFLDACRHLNEPLVQQKLESGSADVWYQDQDGNAPLHQVAIGASGTPNADEETACRIASLLIENGTGWNLKSNAGKLAQCIAREAGLHKLYGLLVDAGVQAELIFHKMDRSGLGNNEDIIEENNESEIEVEESENTGALNTENYLSSRLSYVQDEKLIDSAGNGVMMSWETHIMQKSANYLTRGGRPDLCILSIGFGMGIFDTIIQATNPKLHVIVEMHPDVLNYMRNNGWMDRPNVKVLEGKWQDYVEYFQTENLKFDAIYYDTFAEDYAQLFQFWVSIVARTLCPESGRHSFFHGLGGDNQTTYDVYTKLIGIELREIGLECAFESIDVSLNSEDWKNIKYQYWQCSEYRMPTIALY